MQYNRLGKSGLKLPAVSLGLWHNFGDTAQFSNMKELCFTAFDNGITHFDYLRRLRRTDQNGADNAVSEHPCQSHFRESLVSLLCNFRKRANFFKLFFGYCVGGQESAVRHDSAVAGNAV